MKGFKKMMRLLLLGVFFVPPFVGLSHGQSDYPAKPVTILVPYSAGGTSDIISRLIAEIGKKYFPQPFVVVNKPGASGTIAITQLVTSKPDGYTIAFAGSGEACSALHITPTKYRIDSYTIICRVGNQQLLMATKGPWNSLKEFTDYAKKNPGKIRVGVPGLATVAGFVGEQFRKEAGLQWKVVPFEGSGPLIPAILGNHVEAGLLHVQEILSTYKAGELKVLCTFTEQRSKTIPEVPTAKELGFKVSGGTTHFIIVPNGVPRPIINKLDVLMKKVIEDPEFQAKSIEFGYTNFYEDSKASKTFITEWFKTSGELYDALGMKKK